MVLNHWQRFNSSVFYDGANPSMCSSGGSEQEKVFAHGGQVASCENNLEQSDRSMAMTTTTTSVVVVVVAAVVVVVAAATTTPPHAVSATIPPTPYP